MHSKCAHMLAWECVHVYIGNYPISARRLPARGYVNCRANLATYGWKAKYDGYHCIVIPLVAIINASY